MDLKTRRTRVICLALLLSSSLGAPSSGAERPIVVVFQLRDKGAGLGQEQTDALTEYLAAAVAEGGIFRVVPPQDTQRLLTRKKAESYKRCYDQKCQIELGRRLAANKLLSTSVLRIGGRCPVTAVLYDLKTQTTDISAKDKGPCTQAGISETIDRVAAEIRAWASGRASGGGFVEGAVGDRPTDFEVPAGDEVIVRFSSDPQGAVVLLDGKLLCAKTPCSRAVARGTHLVAMQAERYRARQEQRVLAKGKSVHFRLQPNFGWLTVRSRPAGMEVKIDGRVVGKTPLTRHAVTAGGYEVLVSSPCHFAAGERVRCERGREKTVEVDLVPRQGAVDVRAADAEGNDLEAEVLVDGFRLGTTPGVFKVSVCARELSLRHPKGWARAPLAVEANKRTALRLTLSGGRRPMVLVPAGVFRMGSPAGVGDYDEHPEHDVRVDAFLIDPVEVSVSQYARCVEARACEPPRRAAGCNYGLRGRENHPVNCISWHQAEAYCRWAGKRLCTEAQWEKAARGVDGRTYPWGEAPAICGQHAACNAMNTRAVGSLADGASPLGVLDMAGNVWEWVADRYDQDYYPTSPAQNPSGPSAGSRRVNRGGGFRDGAAALRSANRWWADPSFQGANLGLRCCAAP